MSGPSIIFAFNYHSIVCAITINKTEYSEKEKFNNVKLFISNVIKCFKNSERLLRKVS